MQRLQFLLLTLGICIPLMGGENDPDSTFLKNNGIRPTAEGLVAYFKGMKDTPEVRKRIAELMRQLGDEEFDVREKAAAEIVKAGLVASAALRKGVESDDPEIRMRSRTLLVQMEGGLSSRLFLAALRKTEEIKPPGVIPLLLEILPLCENEYTFDAASRALCAVTRTEDAPLLRKSLSHHSEGIRETAAVALGRLLGEESIEALNRLLNDRSGRVRLAAAKALGNLGQRQCLETLGQLLKSEQLRIRLNSYLFLRGLTKNDIPFVAYETPEKRAEMAKAWEEWITGPGKTAPLHFPVSDAKPILGRTLVCLYGKNKVVEFDASGKKSFEHDVRSPWGVQGLPNGHRLIAGCTSKEVIEFDANGKEIWKKSGLPGNPMSVRRLKNGCTLIACAGVQKVIEVDPAGKTVWEVSVASHLTDAQRLENGNTLICLYQDGKVVEVDRSGKEVWNVEGQTGAVSANRIENGNTLIALHSSGKVVEVDSNGKEVWVLDGLKMPCEAQRLPDGTTLISQTGGISIYNAAKEVVWEKKLGANEHVGRVSRY